jgi:hypothetical protein
MRRRRGRPEKEKGEREGGKEKDGNRRLIWEDGIWRAGKDGLERVGEKGLRERVRGKGYIGWKN